MAIVAGEIVLYPSATVNDTSANGGRMDDTAPIASAVANNVWPGVTPSELTAGVTRKRKMHARIENASNLTFSESGVCLREPVSSDGIGYILGGANHTNTQGDLPGSPTRYGIGTLNSGVSGGATELDIALEDEAIESFRDGDRVRIADATHEEIRTIEGTPSLAGSILTITLDSGLTNSYSAGSTYVSAILDSGDIAGSVENYSTDSASGTLDDTGIVVEHQGAIYQNWSIVMTDATNFRLDGDTLGSNVATGSRSSTFAPINPNTGTPFFTIPSSEWGGTTIAGEIFDFRTLPAVIPYFEELQYPASSEADSGVNFKVRFIGYTP